ISPTAAFVKVGANILFFQGSKVALTKLANLAKIKRITKIEFIGTQRAKGGAVITNVVFKTNNKRVGVVRGITISNAGKETISVIGGRIAKTFKSIAKEGKVFASSDISKLSQKQFNLVKEFVIKGEKSKVKIGRASCRERV